jgi:hypothetical protein
VPVGRFQELAKRQWRPIIAIGTSLSRAFDGPRSDFVGPPNHVNAMRMESACIAQPVQHEARESRMIRGTAYVVDIEAELRQHVPAWVSNFDAQ